MEAERRLRLEIQGAVQGVGFRPFVYRLARELDLRGRVANDSGGVHVEVEGAGREVARFLDRLPGETPPRAIVHGMQSTWHEPRNYSDFRIEESDGAGAKTAFVLPDIATCEACLAEVLEPSDRRHRYAFTNCTHCGPRFTILRALPYDRPSTTMERFRMCEACQGEYDDPLDRRFHAQPNACQHCGPHLELWGRNGRLLAREDRALRRAVDALGAGRILAVKGLGGFHLMVDATDREAVARLRRRKGRDAKPLALMVRDLAAAEALGFVSAVDRELLTSPEAPIVLLERRPDAMLATGLTLEGVAPGCPNLGVMLAYTPLHHLLLGEISFPVVATSGNLSDEPIAIASSEARSRLGGIADLFLVHDRPIARHVDDSVVRGFDGAPQILRRARGYAPLPVTLDRQLPTILAVGGHLKNTTALAIGDQVFVSQHIGDMETPRAHDAFVRVIRDFLEIYQAAPLAIAHDLHPDYMSTRWARTAALGDGASTDGDGGWAAALAGLRLIGVQHHHAHLASCLAENGCAGPALGVTWDGTGHGTDGTVWGGEFLLGDASDYRRVAHLRRFRLLGGDAAVREPRRSAVALLWQLWGEDAFRRLELPPIAAFAPGDLRLLASMLKRGFQSPWTSSAGRLFDAVASLLDLHQLSSFEGQAAMALEHIADPEVDDAYPLPPRPARPRPGQSERALELDWRPLIEAILEDRRRGIEAGVISGRFHNALAEAVVTVARQVAAPRVALTGGCFQNRLLSERTTQRLRQSGFEVLLQRQVPANDGGISLGQVAVAAAQLAADEGS